MNATDEDLAACAREPIQIPNAIQPHGALFVLNPDDFRVVQASANCRAFLADNISLGEEPRGALAPLLDNVRHWYSTDAPFYTFSWADPALAGTAHRTDGGIVIEVEKAGGKPLDEVFAQLRSFTQLLASEMGIEASLNATAKFLRDLTGFDRVLVYRFDTNWNGHVVAEAGNGTLPSYLDMRFPASDIPAQARRLYAVNRLRIIPDASYTPVPIEPLANPLTGAPLDMSFAQLRSVSPVHLEYMRNMGTGASMSVSIMVEGKLWGLLSCHSAGPQLVPQAIRETCDLAAQSLAMRIGGLERGEKAARTVELKQTTSALLEAMASADDWIKALAQTPELLLAQVSAAGALIVDEDQLVRLGKTPDVDDARRLVAWLRDHSKDDVKVTEHLCTEFPRAEPMAETASGILAIRISELRPTWLIWCRPEIVKTVKWGGNPHKLVRENGRIHPRQSFKAWRELLRMQARPWSDEEIAAALELRRAIVGIVLRNAEELAQLSRELQRSNKELEAFSYSVSHDLRAPFRHIVGFAQLLRERETGLDAKSQHYLKTISDAAVSAGRLVDDLLNFSQLGRASILQKRVDMDKLVAEVITSLKMDMKGREIEWRVSPLPVAWGDANLLRQVWYNLLDNAVKYTRPRAVAQITVEGHVDGEIARYRVQDNGVGFDMAYVGKLFGVFQRLQKAEDFEGTGIGLALVRRIIERHNGSIKAEGAIDEGATFTFALPAEQRKGRALA